MIRMGAPSHGFSMVEVLVSAVLFATTSAFIFSLLQHVHEPAAETRSRDKAAQYTRKVLENLRTKVAASTWDTGDFKIQKHALPPDPDFPNINATYNVVADPSGARKVILEVAFPDE
ncbi:MAG: hypothetical protein HQL19_03190 [Candidatus Omnitrophica bacterium]|nr:hypothetical protein [Candidatus Omnitrophota bacterium]